MFTVFNRFLFAYCWLVGYHILQLNIFYPQVRILDSLRQYTVQCILYEDGPQGDPDYLSYLMHALWIWFTGVMVLTVVNWAVILITFILNTASNVREGYVRRWVNLLLWRSKHFSNPSKILSTCPRPDSSWRILQHLFSNSLRDLREVFLKKTSRNVFKTSSLELF